MDEDTIARAGKRFAGKVEGAAGAAFGDSETELRGRARELGGEAQQRYGEAADALRTLAVNQPLTALLAAGVAGAVLGVILSRR
jgi:uncharacterized protein YjbJ (UPF0337 family)